MATYPHCTECGCDLLELQEVESEMCYECQDTYTVDEDSYPNRCVYCEPEALCKDCYHFREWQILSMACPICFSEDVVHQAIHPGDDEEWTVENLWTTKVFWFCGDCGFIWED